MPQGRGKLLLLWMLFVLLCGCHLGGFLLLGNRLRKMGDFGFYGYWASWDLHNVFQRTDRLGTMWTQQEHKGTQKQVGGSSSIAALPQGQESAILPHSSRRGNVEPWGARQVCVISALHGAQHILGAQQMLRLFCLPLYLSCRLKGSFNNYQPMKHSCPLVLIPSTTWPPYETGSRGRQICLSSHE